MKILTYTPERGSKKEGRVPVTKAAIIVAAQINVHQIVRTFVFLIRKKQKATTLTENFQTIFRIFRKKTFDLERSTFLNWCCDRSSLRLLTTYSTRYQRLKNIR